MSVDVAGNASQQSTMFLLVIDTHANQPIISLASGGNTTADSTPSSVITGETGSIATLSIDELVTATSSSGQTTGSVAANQAKCVTFVASGVSLTVDTCLTNPPLDTWIEVYDSGANRIAYDDDSCGNLLSRKIVSVSPTQTYTIVIRGYAWRGLNSYVLRWAN